MKTKDIAKIGILAALVGTCAIGLASCNSKTSTSLRTKLDPISDIAYDFEAGTFSFTAVNHASYYRVYFYDITSPDNSPDYFVSETKTVIETYPDGNTGTSVQTVYVTDENGNYVRKSDEEILALTPTYSKRYNAIYTDESGNKQSYTEGQTVTLDLPNSNIGGGQYLIGVRSGGSIALYTMSDFYVEEEKLILHYVDPEIETNQENFTCNFNQYGATFSEGRFGTSASLDTSKVVLDGDTVESGEEGKVYGMMMEITNASTYYNAGPETTLNYYITDSTGAKVNFGYNNIRMNRNDGNSFCGWTDVESSDGANVQTGTASTNRYVYSHSGPTMMYQISGWVWVYGLTLGETYTLNIQAEGDNGVSAYSSEVTKTEFTYAYSELSASTSTSEGGMPGGPGGDQQMPGGDQQGPTDQETSAPTGE